MSRKIIGVTVGTPLPKPNFKQTDPTKGDYIRNKPDFEGLKSRVTGVEEALDTKQPIGDYALKSEIPAVPVQSVNGKVGEVVLTAEDIGAQPAGDYALKSEIVQADFNETDETSKAFIKNKPTRDDALRLAFETELIIPVTDENGAIYTDLNGEILSL